MSWAKELCRGAGSGAEGRNCAGDLGRELKGGAGLGFWADFAPPLVLVSPPSLSFFLLPRHLYISSVY